MSYFIISVAVDSAFDIVGRIQSGDVPLNAESVSELVSKESQDNERSTDIATMALVALWVIGIVDSYREGRARERSKDLNTKS